MREREKKREREGEFNLIDFRVTTRTRGNILEG